jgi:curved DNA-binding protein CbpA
MNEDLYGLLGVRRDAGEADIRRAFRAIARQTHPDHHPGEHALSRFKKVSAAYHTLIDPERRRRYDAHPSRGSEGVTAPPPPSQGPSPEMLYARGYIEGWRSLDGLALVAEITRLAEARAHPASRPPRAHGAEPYACGFLAGREARLAEVLFGAVAAHFGGGPPLPGAPPFFVPAPLPFVPPSPPGVPWPRPTKVRPGSR